MRLVVLIVIAALIAVAAIGSYMHFRSWSAGRFNAVIIEAAERHDVDPALLKAIVEVQTRAVQRGQIRIGEGDSRWGLISRRIANIYLEAHGRREWGYVCPSRRFANHDPDQPEQFTSTAEEYKNNRKKQVCRTPGCGQPLVEELQELRTNLDVVAWFLAEAKRSITTQDEAQHRSRSPRELRALMILAYGWGLPARLDLRGLPDEQLRYVQQVEAAYAQLRPQFDAYAKQHGDTSRAPAAPF